MVRSQTMMLRLWMRRPVRLLSPMTLLSPKAPRPVMTQSLRMVQRSRAMPPQPRRMRGWKMTQRRLTTDRAEMTCPRATPARLLIP